MKATFSILFYLKKRSDYSNGPLPIYLRITVDGKRAETATSREIHPNQWITSAGRAKGNKEETKILNAYLDTLQNQVYEINHQLTVSKVEITADALKSRLTGKLEPSKMILEIFKEHNDRIEVLVGKDYALGTLCRYKTSLKHTYDFIRRKYKTNDIDIKKIDHEFITGYEFYLRSVRKCANNSAVKYIRNFQKIVNICLDNGWLQINPFLRYKAKVKQVDRVFLNQTELELIAAKNFGSERVNVVRDIFLFCCFTGLAYADVQKLKPSEIVTGVDGEAWISTSRLKTGTHFKIPLLPSALKLIEKYKEHPICKVSLRTFPVITNQKMNAYLKEIAEISNIEKTLTFHIARHTFATTVTLANGVPIETVSKMLGHTNIKTTQHYAKILDVKVGEDMALLKNKYS